MIKSVLVFNIFFFFYCFNYNVAQSREIVAYYHGGGSDKNVSQEKILESRGIFDKITVINYSFAIPAPDSLGNFIPELPNSFNAYQKIYNNGMSVDGIPDDSTQPLRGQFNQFKKIKLRYPHLKIMISIGGWGGSKYFSDLALTPESRTQFVDTCIDIFISGNLPLQNNAGGIGSGAGVFDGIDLDWEFPLTGGPEGTHYHPNDRENHTELFKLFREKLNLINQDLLLTAAVSGRSNEFYIYNFNQDQKYLDWINIMSYDLHGIADYATGHHTNLLSSEFDIDPKKESLDRAVKYLLDSAGVAPEKIIPGAAFYGKGWQDVDSINNGVYQTGTFLNKWGYIRFENYSDYSEISENGYEYSWDDNTLAPSLYSKNEKIFWSFDDLCSIALKARYVDAYNLRGLMFWQIFGDDTLGTLTNTIYNRNMPDVIFENSNIK